MSVDNPVVSSIYVGETSACYKQREGYYRPVFERLLRLSGNGPYRPGGLSLHPSVICGQTRNESGTYLVKPQRTKILFCNHRSH